MMMEDELRSLKECLDDTYFKDLELSKTIKKKIIKQSKKSSRTSQHIQRFKYAASLVLAVGCLVLLVQSFIPEPKNNQASLSTVRQQQVALIHFQNEIIKLVSKQKQSETDFLTAIVEGKSNEEIELNRAESMKQGEEIIAGLKRMVIPSELSPYQEIIRKCLEELETGYELKNAYFKDLTHDTYQGFSVDYEYVDKLFQFDRMMVPVYKAVEFRPVTYVGYFNLRDYREE
ncbi:hypothetical protein QFZ87_004761 [Bacillus sp. SLBN-46]|uniref:hypothetical protein n=1 Tax=Bacillus sp. SLBN-46 TaxID=3042283 RepID=UPI00285767E1|nr:hypothetical protein [Bacillus sp. SLBN-46]MDR6125164.1 hypothetical protein [Bacillus sp. SLBN-46]